MQLRALLFLVFSVFVMLGCQTKAPELSLADIRVPDPERDLRRELGVKAIWELQYNDNDPDNIKLDTIQATSYDSLGRELHNMSPQYMGGRYHYSYSGDGWLDTLFHWSDILEHRYYDYIHRPDSNMMMKRMKMHGSEDWYDTTILFYNDLGNIFRERSNEYMGVIYEFDSLNKLMNYTKYYHPQSFYYGYSRLHFYYPGPILVKRYHYEGTGVLIDSIAETYYDLDGMNVHNGSTKYFNDQGLPTYTAYERGDTIWYQVELFE